MIDHFEQGAQQNLIDELEAVSPSLATWAWAEFDAGVSATSIRRLLFDASADATRLQSTAADLVAAVQFDDTGAMIAGQLRGGNGGLLSRETLHKAGLVQLTLNDIKKLPPAGKEG
ncbi:hypothetical protein FF80_03309 [Devosia sp. LC5]|uniref:hypothetical protein n=1 Tax=Devosia sp. LC5 TaxID=1502724 RepID=UPI0004E333EF|nr:hypothetical protein [Devosia sp. LC5]KFC62742.1 hypothetical protein FF80_03309 [Devosia sp. LC5]